MSDPIDDERWNVTVRRLGGDVAVPGAPGLRADPELTVAWVAVERPFVLDDDGEELEPIETDPDLLSVAAATDRLLGRTPRPWVGAEVEAALLGLDPPPVGPWAGAHVARLAHALVAAAVAGHVTAGGTWNVHVDDSAGVAMAALPAVMDLVGGLADGWDPTLAPSRVTTNHGSFARSGSGYRPVAGALTTVPDVWIRLEHDRTPTDPLPGVLDAPVVVVRPAPGTADPGPVAPPGPPPDLPPAAAAAARWCFGTAEPTREMLDEIAGLFDGSWPSVPERASALVAEAWRLRDVADLLLDAWPGEPAALCLRAQVEAMSPAGRRERVAGLVDAAMATAAQTPTAVEPIRRLALVLRAMGRAGWLADMWAAADRHGIGAATMEEDVLGDPNGSSGDELALVLARRLERVRIATAGGRPGQDGDG